MAVEVNVLELQARTESLEKAIGTLGNLSAAGAKTETSFKDLALRIAGYTSVANIAVQAGQALLRGIKDLAVESVTLAAGFEKSRMTWGVLVGDMQRGSKVFDQLYQFAAKTPLSFQGVEHAAQTLKGMGVATEDLVGVMGRLGDVAMGDDAKLQRVSLVYGQVVAKGKADTRDLWQFVDAGVPIVNLLSETLGVTGGEVLKLTADGKIGFAQVEAAIKKATDKGGQFYQLMDKVAETTSGKWSTALDNWKNALAEIGSTTLPAINKALDEFNRQMDRASQVRGAMTALGGNADASMIQTAINNYKKIVADMDAAKAAGKWKSAAGGGLGLTFDAERQSFVNEIEKLQSALTIALGQQAKKSAAAGGSVITAGMGAGGATALNELELAMAELRKKFWEIDQSSAWATSQGEAFDVIKEKASALDKIVGDLIEKGFTASGSGIKSLDTLAQSLGFVRDPLGANMQAGYRQISWADVMPGMTPWAPAASAINDQQISNASWSDVSRTPWADQGVTPMKVAGRHGAVQGSAQENTLDELTDQYKRLTQGVSAYEKEQKKAAGWTEDEIFSYQILKQKIDDVTKEQARLEDFKKKVEQAKNALYSIGEQGFVDTFKSLGEALASGADAGDSLAASIANVGKSILDQAPMLFLQLAVSAAGTGNWPLALGLLGLSGLTAFGSGVASYYSDNAIGGVYSSSSLHSYVNGVYDSPRLFSFAKGGAMGRFAEAGPEAIMPLSRTSTGELGVRSHGGGSTITVVNELGIKADATVEETRGSDGGKQTRIFLRKAVTELIASGAADKALTSRLSGSRVAGRRVS